MKVLFMAGGSRAPIFSSASLATATRSAGHGVLVATMEAVAPVVASLGLPPVVISSRSKQRFAHEDADVRESRNGGDTVTEIRFGGQVRPDDPEEEKRRVGHWYGELAAESLPRLREIARHWEPDLVVGGTLNYAAPFLARQLGIPSVRQSWDANDPTSYDEGAERALWPSIRELGLRGLPEPDLRIEVAPLSLLPVSEPQAQMMRWVPVNQQRALEPWMFGKGDRRRVLITAGSRVGEGDGSVDFFRELARNLAPLDAEIVVAAPEEIAAELRAECPEVHAGWVPLDLVAPTCDLVVHHAGGVTGMTALSAGVPQLLILQSPSVDESRRLAEYGAGITLEREAQTLERISSACVELLTDPSYRNRSRELAAEINSFPTPNEVVPVLEKLVVSR
ncbi:nucleotide disphospho-sugar-binding domain-containing protein [Haloechinothrix sp. LS1_15]|uniref:nucleotide disphospho-sugar-binding domain-containing protein n=1 Tax=Haloechinothrix sp. LS1_15 TaxID=2652248 RepID=UPI00294714FB|nr:nucleotide disphospho-sugar-binding domain-containing protein [Haloechinothrix sp. LS1_15]MDV6011625.1 DUF1205 domain-containing protein [Haloechinothrix sp. LS1_15]